MLGGGTWVGYREVGVGVRGWRGWEQVSGVERVGAGVGGGEQVLDAWENWLQTASRQHHASSVCMHALLP